MPGIHARIVDINTGVELPPGQDGRLQVRAGSVMKGYLGQPELTAQVIQNHYYDTGDIAHMDEDGYIYITGRASRFSKIGGEMVPHEGVEDAITKLLHSENREVAVAGRSDRLKGERLVIFYTPENLDIPGIIAGDGEEQDAYILGVSEPITEFNGQVVAAICRKNDCEDKLVVAPVESVYHQGQIAEAVHFQERYFDTRIISCFEKSCGVLPYRMVNGQQEFLLVFETYSKCWSLPKGHIEAGETDVQTALRELYEETGLTANLDTSRCASIEYPISSFARKQVAFFLGEVTGVPKVREGEIDKFQWVTAEELKDYLFPDTYEACKALLR